MSHTCIRIEKKKNLIEAKMRRLNKNLETLSRKDLLEEEEEEIGREGK